jgi:hypothetical protein
MKHKMHPLTLSPIVYRTIVLDYKIADGRNGKILELKLSARKVLLYARS